MAVRTIMKRILVIDESEVVRETLALILSREFAVSKRSLGTKGLPPADASEDVDLLILGVSPYDGLETGRLVQLASRLPFAVLFLVESKSTARVIESSDSVECLTKPFNPYELQERVGQLLTRGKRVPARQGWLEPAKREDDSRYLEFPFLSRSAASLVQRFAATKLPLLIHGELGCGQLQVASVIHRQQGGICVAVNAAVIDVDYLAEKRKELWSTVSANLTPITLLVENLDRCEAAAQTRLAEYIAEAQQHTELRLLSTANADLLARVYRGEFPEGLYYQLAVLSLHLPPLRERATDIPALAQSFARRLARSLGVREPTFSPAAHERLSKYLWFGNLRELETVVARTMALRSKDQIDAADLVFDFGGEIQAIDASELVEFVPPGGADSDVGGSRPPLVAQSNGHAKSVDLNLVIHELAHEFKNPMVTIKTFAQLLGERYQDENFRSRFQEVVGGDIERMDDLLEVMIEFADFTEPRQSAIALVEKTRDVLGEISSQCSKRQTRFDWKKNGRAEQIRSDEKHLTYILKNVLLAVTAEAKTGSEIEIDVSQPGVLAITSLREGARMGSVSHYLGNSGSQPEEGLLPLRVLLAKQLVEKNGGRFIADRSDAEKDIVRMEFPIVEHGKEN
jgi:DNA-binding NtrC family response regulator